MLASTKFEQDNIVQITVKLAVKRVVQNAVGKKLVAVNPLSTCSQRTIIFYLRIKKQSQKANDYQKKEEN